jgi:Plasmid encoded RepA protein
VTNLSIKQLSAKAGELSPVKKRLLEGLLGIHAELDAVERAYMAQQLVLCTLPHRDPGDVPRWMRRTGSTALVMQPGWDATADKSYGYPYGTVPRLLLFWITAEVQKTKNRTDTTEIEKRTLKLGKSMKDFMRAVGLNPGRGGKRSDAQRLRKQIVRLFECRIKFQAEASDLYQTGSRNKHSDFAEDSELWWNPRHPEQDAMWESWVLLGAHFYESLLNSVPLDMRALRALKNSPLALDLYAWSCYKAYLILQKKQGPQFVAWGSLKEQFGTEYATENDFQKKASAALRKVEGVYPGLTIRKARGGFTVHATRLAVPPKMTLFVEG